MTNFWVLQGNPKKWDRPDKLFSEPILGWSVTGVEGQVEVGDGVLVWMANTNPDLRGVHAAGKISGRPRTGYPLGWGDSKQKSTLTPFVPLAIHWYLVHHPVRIDELRGSAFASHQILSMARRTAYPCSSKEFDAAIELMRQHGPTTLPGHPAAGFSEWWNTL
ncbi:EVE domain-containing protein [Knoellia aerolata]|uniref:EVE domain-containing protein n=1 Tax=Knoellia aerolata TaxID=442954 RepID=UPI0012EDAA38|nr:EVE domain-containing protein [Knoellia aerolata]